jgi:hypothetical protein
MYSILRAQFTSSHWTGTMTNGFGNYALLNFLIEGIVIHALPTISWGFIYAWDDHRWDYKSHSTGSLQTKNGGFKNGIEILIMGLTYLREDPSSPLPPLRPPK